MVLKEAALKAGATEDDYKKFIAYVCGFYGNMGNYHNFGGNKFAPELSQKLFLDILKSNPLYNDADAFYREVIDELYPEVQVEIFNCEAPYTILNYPTKGGTTAYFGRNLTDADLELITEFCNN